MSPCRLTHVSQLLLLPTCPRLRRFFSVGVRMCVAFHMRWSFLRTITQPFYAQGLHNNGDAFSVSLDHDINPVVTENETGRNIR